MTRPRVLIADDHQATRVVVREALELGGCDVVAETDTAYDAVDLARRLTPDACLLDIAMPGGGLWALREIVAFSPTVPCVMLTVSDRPPDLFEALDSGASGYLIKGVPLATIPQAVFAALDGDVALRGRFNAQFIDAMGVRANRIDHAINTHGRPITFTNRESDVLDLLVSGATTVTIASRLLIRTTTVRRHISDAMRKLQVGSRAEAVSLLRAQREDPQLPPRPPEDTHEP